MNQVSLFEAWRQWLSGNLVHESVLWGFSILWWGRIGKIVQFAAALTIIADIIGPERLRLFGNSLHGAFSLKKVDYYLHDAFAHTKATWNYVRAPSEKVAEALAAVKEFKSDHINMFVCLGLTILGGFFLWPRLGGWLTIISAAVGYFVLLVSISPVMTILTLFVVSLLGLLIDFLIVEPIAWIIERPHIDKWVKIMAVILLILGFHFDLLAS